MDTVAEKKITCTNTMSLATEQKETLRKQLAKTYARTQLDTYITDAVARLTKTALWKQATDVLAYAPISDEIPFLETLMKMYTTKRWFLPQTQKDSMLFKQVLSTTPLTPGYLGVPEPTQGTEWKPTMHTLCIVPSRALDIQGNRLGRGRGHYDKFLKDYNVTTVSIVPDFAFLQNVPTEDHDMRIDFPFKSCPNT